MKPKNMILEITPLEQTVLASALKRYIEYCNDCLDVPDNEDQRIFIKGDIQSSRALLERLRQ